MSAPSNTDVQVNGPERARPYGWSRGMPGRHAIVGFKTVFGVDLRTLALFRILLGLYLIADVCLRLRDLSAHYSDAGIMPRATQLDHLSAGSYSLHLVNGSSLFQAGLFTLALLAAFCLIVGFRTRIATIASWVLLLSVQNRNTFILSGEDNLALLLLFWAMFLPLGARYSIDASLDRSVDGREDRYFSVATLALLVQGMSMYFFSALLKSDARWIPEGTAVFYALNLDYMVTPFGLWLRQFEPLLRGLTYYVFVLELIGPILIFSPVFHRTLRPLIMVAFITMHIGFLACLEIGLFPVISIIMNLAFLPSRFWDRAEWTLAQRRPADLVVWYDKDCAFCLKTCRLLRMMLFLGKAPIRCAQDVPHIRPVFERDNSWVVGRDGALSTKWDAMSQLVGASPVFRFVAPLLGVSAVVALGNRAYDHVAANRPALAGLSAKLFPWRTIPVRLGGIGSMLAGLVLVFVTIQNLSTLPMFHLKLPQSFVQARQMLGLYQHWTMFAPYPELTSPWPIVEGRLMSGQKVDVYKGKVGPAERIRPEVVSAAYPNYRWRKFLSQLEDQSYEDVNQFLALSYGRYLCRSWNARAEGGNQLFTLQIEFGVELTGPPGTEKKANNRVVWYHDCFG